MYQQVHLTERVVQTVAKGLDRRAQIASATTARWDISGRCERPVYREMKGRPRPEGFRPWHERFKRSSGMQVLELETRCRKCGPCLRYRAAQWRRRCETELKQSVRTWFVTLTLRPEEHFKALCRASLRLAERGESFEALSADAQLGERHLEIGPEVTKWLKRIRKQSGSPIKYCLVVEAHKSGLPHYHLLISELDADRPLRAAVIKDQWSLGFSDCRLVAKTDEAAHASYAAKYLSKSAAARVRASKGYGVANADTSPPKAIGPSPTDRAPTYDPSATSAEILLSLKRPAYHHGAGLMPARAFRRRTEQ